MSRIVLWSVLLVVLVSSALILMPRAEAWSEPVYTKPWTEEEAEDEEVIEETVSVPEEVVGETVMETKETEEEEEEIDEFLLDFTPSLITTNTPKAAMPPNMPNGPPSAANAVVIAAAPVQPVAAIATSRTIPETPSATIFCTKQSIPLPPY